MKSSKHFKQMIIERNIEQKWVEDAIKIPDRVEEMEDGTRHYLKQIAENENRWLRVIVNVKEKPNKKITLFFDRRLRRK
jgi:hypothetical protein